MKYIFGISTSAQRLEKLLNDNPIARRKISRMLSQYTSTMYKILAGLSDDISVTYYCMELHRDYNLRRIDIMKNISDDIRSYAKNVVIGRYRITRRMIFKNSK
jgi:predicted transcriptional regulator